MNRLKREMDACGRFVVVFRTQAEAHMCQLSHLSGKTFSVPQVADARCVRAELLPG